MRSARARGTSVPEPSSALDTPEIVEVKAGVFKNTCLELMDDVQAHHKHIVITKHGHVVAKLVPPDEHPVSAFGFLRGTLLAHQDIVSPDFEAWGDVT
jgi:antitoxin (DNA-binding transcriptional repressor) of toxin-antitoxin stability system